MSQPNLAKSSRLMIATLVVSQIDTTRPRSWRRRNPDLAYLSTCQHLCGEPPIAARDLSDFLTNGDAECPSLFYLKGHPYTLITFLLALFLFCFFWAVRGWGGVGG